MTRNEAYDACKEGHVIDYKGKSYKIFQVNSFGGLPLTAKMIEIDEKTVINVDIAELVPLSGFALKKAKSAYENEWMKILNGMPLKKKRK
jgi:hypothetical protein